jgi:hypothetical protein
MPLAEENQVSRIRLSEIKDPDLVRRVKEIIAIQENMGQAIRDRLDAVTCPMPEPKKKGPTKAETTALAYLKRTLTGGYTILEHESITLKVGAERCRYTPDFPVIRPDGMLVFYEVKGGHVWDDARVKFQSAKRQYPWFDWYWLVVGRTGEITIT